MLVIIELTTSMKFIGLSLINLKFERLILVKFILNWIFFFLFFLFFLHSAIMKQDTETILHKMNFILLIIILIALFQTITDIKDVLQDSVLK